MANSINFQGRGEEIKPLFEELLRQIQLNTRPANEIIIDDVDLRDQLKVSARTTSDWRSRKLIKHSKIQGKIYYKYSDVLDFIDRFGVNSIEKSLRIKP